MCDLATPKQREREEARLLGEFAEGHAFGKRFGDGVAAVGVGVVAGAAGLVSHGVVDELADFGAVERLALEQRACHGLEAGAVLAEHLARTVLLVAEDALDLF